MSAYCCVHVPNACTNTYTKKKVIQVQPIELRLKYAQFRKAQLPDLQLQNQGILDHSCRLHHHCYPVMN
jgi:hypothetical protein